MKINDSAVAMSGRRSLSRYQETHVSSTLVRASQWRATREEPEVDVSISEKSQSLLEQSQKAKRTSEQKKTDFEEQSLDETEKAQKTQSPAFKLSEKDEQMLKTLRRILGMLKRLRNGNRLSDSGLIRYLSDWEDDISASSEEQTTQTTASQRGLFSLTGGSSKVLDLRSASSVRSGTGTKWIRHVEKSGFLMEQENTSFSASGLVRTADGREIEFGVELEMSRGFAGAFFSSYDTEAVLTDPLVINLDSKSAGVTDQKFYFDLDADGKQEEISQLASGSGFLAYDKNGDGKINDGSELFGTKSGDGFKDLAAYDEDGNGWIDENDDIFNHLKVWTKDGDGNDKLLNLKEANVGAIYLGSADTRFHLNQAYTNQTNAVIQKTGVFLKETGEAGTIQHVDLAV